MKSQRNPPDLTKMAEHEIKDLCERAKQKEEFYAKRENTEANEAAGEYYGELKNDCINILETKFKNTDLIKWRTEQ